MKHVMKNYLANFITLASFGIPIACLHIGGIMATVGLIILWAMFLYVAIITAVMIFDEERVCTNVVSAHDEKKEIAHDI